MGIRDLFSRRKAATGDSTDAPTRDDQPGSVSSQLDTEGGGPVGLQDRTAPGGQGSPDTNQAKTEPIPSTPGHSDPNAEYAAPELGDMNVGSADPQTPSHPAARDRDVPLAGGAVPSGPINTGASPAAERGTYDPAVGSGLASGPGRPESVSDGTGQRAPGSLGVSPEEQETDLDAGAAAMTPEGATAPGSAPGDAFGVGETSDQSSPGTSQEQGIVQGARTPTADS